MSDIWGMIKGAGKSLFSSFIGGAGQNVSDKAQGIPSPATGSAAGLLQRQYMESAFPGSSTLDRLGISQASQGVEVGKQNQRNQAKERTFLAGQQEKQLQNNKDVAMIQTGSREGVAKRDLDLRQKRHTEIDVPISQAQLKEHAQQLKNLGKDEQIKIAEVKKKLQEWAIGQERLTIEQVKAKYAELIAASGIVGKGLAVASGIVGVGAMLMGVKGLIKKGARKAIGAFKNMRAKNIPSPVTTGRRIKSTAPNKTMRVRITKPRKSFGKKSNLGTDRDTANSRRYWQKVMRGKKE